MWPVLALDKQVQIVTPLKCAACCHVGLLFTCCRDFREGVCVCVRVCVLWKIHGPWIYEHTYWNNIISPPPSQRGNIVAMIMCHELSGPISAPWPAPRREQKADLHRLMSGTVCFLTAHMKHEKCFWEFTQGKSLVPFLQASLVFFFFFNF